MQSRIIKRWSALVGVVLVSIVIAAFGARSARQVDAVEAPSQTPYADAKWVKLGDVVPTETPARDLYVRLIAIEGQVLLPVEW